ncbi:MAG: Hsp70 family protein [Gammaproteobacteria bacterium]
MSGPHYAIGIDLGTTNCVLAYVDLAVKHGRVAVLPIPQLQTRDTVAAGPLLPSFYYLGTEAYEPPCLVPGLAPTTALGVYARAQLDGVPGRVIHSAKSWLAHGGIDREARLLPLGSEAVPDTDKRSPIEVSAAYLAYLRAAWDATIGQADPGAAFDRQHLIVTVPASFDEAAQALTRRAAALAGYPDGFRLLEEPQAAFYAWSAGAGAGAGKDTRAWLTERLPGLSEEAQTVLVCDIGGGTTDLSLFRLAFDSDAPGEDAPGEDTGLPDIERLAVGDHLLLGGDNIDLAIAHLIEARALGQSIRSGPERRFSRRQWQHLVPQSMLLKERILSGEGPPEEVFHVSIPGEGGGLFASVSSATLTRADLSEVILDGFFPVTEAGERPRTRQMGLREIGLPYAVDTAVSRHLAGFLDGQAVDAVLFAGGTLMPRFLQERLLTIVERWQDRRPIGLALPDLSLAIAEGAAQCAALVAQSRRRIRAGYARSVYLELHRERPEDATELVCILPQGFEEGRSSTLESRTFDLLLNRPARFTAYSSTHRREDRPGAIVRLDEGTFNPLPPLHTTLTLDEAGFDPRKAEPRSVDVNLEVELTPLGVLQTMLVSEPLGRRWRLDFNLRGAAEPRDATGPAPPGVADEVLRAACGRIAHFYGKKQDLGQKDSAKPLIKDLERTLGQPRAAWSLPLLRGLWPSLYPGMTRRGRSLAHENTWLYLAGFLLRPGYGAELDPWRLSQLWGAWSLGVHHKKEKSAQSNWWMMWRRVAGGLSAEQQRRLHDALMSQFRKSPVESPEATRLLGALELLPLTTRTELAKSLFAVVLRGRAEDQPAVFGALARLCSRVPLYAAADAVLPPALVEDWFERVAGLDWPRQGLKGLASVFSAACRVTGTRALDIHAPVRLRVIEKLKHSGAREADWRVVQEYHEVTVEDRSALFGEELPAGLRLLE